MILLITPSARAKECAQALQQATSEPAQVASNLRQAASCLRTQEFSAIVIDQSALDLEPDESGAILEHMGTAVPVYVNFAINGTERIVRELRLALQRREREGRIARQAAESELRNQLKGTATAILVSCELALKSPNLPAAAVNRMQTVHGLAQDMCGKLGISD